MAAISRAAILGAAPLALAGLQAQSAVENKKDGKVMSTDRKILVVYFSHSGNTRAIANRLHGLPPEWMPIQPPEPHGRRPQGTPPRRATTFRP